MKNYILKIMAFTFFSIFLTFTIDHSFIDANQSSKEMRLTISSNIRTSDSMISSIISIPYSDRNYFAFASNSSNDKRQIAGDYAGNFSGFKIDRSASENFNNFTNISNMGNNSSGGNEILNEEINGSTITDLSNNLSSAPIISTITYTPKFVCGAISSSNGPLRPGYYDTDISIFNKQDYPVDFLWNMVITDGHSSNAIIKKLSAETSTKISCSDLFTLLPYDVKFLEGFIVITIPVRGSMIGVFPDSRNSGVSLLKPIDRENANLIDVQVFYTANALPNLPQDIIIEKAMFRLLNDSSGKIPKEFLNTDLEVAFPLQHEEIYDPLYRIKAAFGKQYGLTDLEASKLKVIVTRTDLSTSFQQDDHAISSSRILPNIAYDN
jgi:hypothetical protein